MSRTWPLTLMAAVALAAAPAVAQNADWQLRRQLDREFDEQDRRFRQQQWDEQRRTQQRELHELEAERRRLRNDEIERRLNDPAAPVYPQPYPYARPPDPYGRAPNVGAPGCRALQPAYDQFGRLIGNICVP